MAAVTSCDYALKKTRFSYLQLQWKQGFTGGAHCGLKILFSIDFIKYFPKTEQPTFDILKFWSFSIYGFVFFALLEIVRQWSRERICNFVPKDSE